MTFALNGTVISGGNFYSVSGNVNQVFGSHAPRLEEAERQRQLGPHIPQSSPGIIRSRRQHRETIGRPYPIDKSSQHHVTAQKTNTGSTSSDALPPGAETAAIHYNGTQVDRDLCLDTSQHPRHGGFGSATGDIGNATYSIGGDMTQVTVTSLGESGIDILYRFVVTQALHDSVERFPEPACHPGTRIESLQDLRSWSVETNAKPIYWLHGSAGIGKSAIAQLFAGDCNETGRLGASFFFKRGHSKRGTWDGLIATIAYQLANAVPELSKPIQKAVEKQKLIAGTNIPKQFWHLLREPCKQVSDLLPTPVVILDGLDECAGHKHQQRILELFIDAIRAGELPIRLLISSRPEPHIRRVLEAAVSVSLCHSKVLAANSDDIRRYLQSEFFRIRFEFRSRGVDLGQAWPAPETLNHLVNKSSGVFIYATTIIRYIEDEYSHPADRLAAVMALDPDSTAPLDDLYAQILSVLLPQAPEKLLILYSILHPRQSFDLVPEDIDVVLGLSRGRSRLMLDGLHSLLQVPPIQIPLVRTELVRPLHASLLDYLCDSRRSGKWCIAKPSVHEDLIKKVIRFLSDPAFLYRRNLRRTVAKKLHSLFKGIILSADLIALLHNTHFRESIFSQFDQDPKVESRELITGISGTRYCLTRYQRTDSSYPMDLIELWWDQMWLVDYLWHLSRFPQIYGPSCQFDSLYTAILSQHADVLLLMRTLVLFRNLQYQSIMLENFVDILNLSLSTLKPFLFLRDAGYYKDHQAFNSRFPGIYSYSGHYGYSFSSSTSPVNFLQDPQRAGSLYSPLEEIIEEWTLIWIRFAQEPLDSSGERLRSLSLGLDVIQHCRPSLTVLYELESLDLVCPCREANIDWVAHQYLHREYFKPARFRNVLDWLSKFPHSPTNTVSHWERQLADVERCTNACKDAKSDIKDTSI